MRPNGCSGGVDKAAAAINRLRGKGQGQKLWFTGCCDQHDLFYAQGGPAQVRQFADKMLRQCIHQNILDRGKRRWVAWHVSWAFYLGVRGFGWIYWGRNSAKLAEALLDIIIAKRMDYHTPTTCPPGRAHCRGADDATCRRCWLMAAMDRADE